jgi:hypothetical protein
VDETRKTRDGDLRVCGNNEQTMGEKRLSRMISKLKNGRGVRGVIHKHGVNDDSIGGLSEREEIAGKRKTDFMAGSVGAECLRNGGINFAGENVMASQESGNCQTTDSGGGVNHWRRTKGNYKGGHRRHGYGFGMRERLGVSEGLKRGGEVGVVGGEGATKFVETGARKGR